MKKFLLSTLLVFISILANAQTNPAITSWMRNTTNAVGYNNLPCNVQSVYYTSTDAYVSASDIPAYSIGPWQANPNTPSNQNNISKFTLNPVEKTGTKTNTGLGAIGIWKNGVQIFNPKDGQYWNNATSSFSQGITQNGYNRNALYWEGVSFDNCKGHAGPNGAYHHHISPSCLYSESASTVHSPIIGFAYDGFPIYGPFAFTNTNGTGAIKRLISSYVLGTSRTNGPPVNTTYPMGSMCEDYTYTSGAGDLDQYNGRFSVTPEYPNGIYAYFATVNASGTAQYPFILGPQYYGVVTTGTNQIIPTNAVQYTGSGLPVDIYSFSVRLINTNTANLYWNVGTEQNVKSYQVQRSNNGVDFSTINSVTATGNIAYQSDDKNLSNGKYYYRIQTLDKDGKYNYSSIVTVVIDSKNAMLVHNNPAKDILTIQENDGLVNRSVDIFDMSGKLVLHTNLSIGTTMKTFDIQTLYSGVYVIKVSNGTSFKTSKLVITKD